MAENELERIAVGFERYTADVYAAGFRAGLEAAAKATDGERLTDGTGEATDRSYNAAIRHCAAAIRALPTPDQERDSKPPR